MKHASMTQRLIGFSLVMVLLVVLISLFILVPSIRRTKELKRHVEETQTALEQDYQKTIQLRRSVRELEQVYADVQQFAQATIRPGDELLVITELETLAATHDIEQNLHVSFTDPSAVPAGERKNLPTKLLLPYYTFSFLNHGTLEQQLRFLEAIEQLPYYLIIDAMQWEQRGGEGERVTLRFDARVYANNE